MILKKYEKLLSKTEKNKQKFGCNFGSPNIGTLAHPVGSALTKIKTTQKVVLIFGSPNRIRTGVLALKGRCPRPLDDGAKTAVFISNAGKLYMLFLMLSSK